MTGQEAIDDRTQQNVMFTLLSYSGYNEIRNSTLHNRGGARKVKI